MHEKILGYLRGLRIPFIRNPRQSVVPLEQKWSPKELEIVNKLLMQLLQMRAVSVVDPCDGQYVSKVFTVPKSDCSYRLILKLKDLNQFVKTSHFKIEDRKIVARLISQHCFMSTIDLKDAYHLIPIAALHRKYLRFTFNGLLYQYNCLPFGLSCAPRIFTKLLKPLITSLREKGMMLVVYLDDFLILENSECVVNVRLTVELLSDLGFLINYPKCSLIPSNICTFLGFVYDSTYMRVSLPKEKQGRILAMLSHFLSLPECSIRDFAKLVGTLVSACPAIKYGFLHTKLLERHKYLALKKSRGNYDKRLKVSHYLLEGLT